MTSEKTEGSCVTNVTGNIAGNIAGNIPGNIAGKIAENIPGSIPENITWNTAENIMKNIAESYINDMINIFGKLDAEEISGIIKTLEDARNKGKRIFVAGNGGSAATANHFACDLGKNAAKEDERRFRIISLSENIEAITAYGNDCGYENIFSEQLKNHFINPGEVVLAISASGNSPNILKLVEYAKSRNAEIISLTGFSGGKLKEMSDQNINVASDSYEKIEDIHLMIAHIIVFAFKYGNL